MKWLVSVFGSLVFLGCILAVGFILPSPAGIPAKGLISYDQFLSVSLTAITVVLAVIALLMAYLAFEGKNQIVDKAREVAKEEFEKLKPLLIDDLKNDANNQVQKFMDNHAKLYANNPTDDVASNGNHVPSPGVKEKKYD